MVKVWHPDRFGNDARLREKAETKLKEINEAYRLLLTDRDAGESGYSAVPAEPTSSNIHVKSSSSKVVQSRRGRPRRYAVRVGWVYAGLAVVVAFMLGLFVFAHSPVRDTGVAHDPASPAEDVKGQGAAESPSPGVPEAVIAGDGAHSPGAVDDKAPSKELRDVKGVRPAGFSVRPLSDAETLRIETACSKLKEGQTVYQRCVKAQLDLITNASGRPDLGGLNREERESIESVCAGGNGRVQTYNRCLIAQLADVSAEPVRPDVSTFRGDDRSAVELACRNAKHREGPAAYDRCVARTIRLLEQSR